MFYLMESGASYEGVEITYVIEAPERLVDLGDEADYVARAVGGKVVTFEVVA